MKRYKDIFFFTLLIFIIVLFVYLLSLTLVSASVSNISQIVFSNEELNVGIGEISGELNIQTQNSAGLIESLDETADLTLISSSATGEFSSSNTSWTADNVLTMNKTWSNRKFYYKDSTAGSFTITAVLTTRTTGKSWTTTQIINIGGDTPDEEEGENEQPNSTSTSKTKTDKALKESSHSAQDELSELSDLKSKLKIIIGRDRVAFSGVPINFQARNGNSGDKESSRIKYEWSFGDGAIARGSSARHIYMYPGEYNLVVNAELKDDRTVARIKVKVLAPDLELGKVSDGSISIKNKSKNEVNLGGYHLSDPEQKYNFPNDTIISAGQTIIFPKEYIKLHYQGWEIFFLDYLGRKLFSLI